MMKKKKYFVTFIDNCIRNDYVYLLNGKDEAIEMFRQYNIKVENQLGKKIRGDKNGEYESACAELCLYPSNCCPIHLNLMKNRTLKEMMDALFISSGLPQNLCGGTILTAKGNDKKFCLFRKKAILLVQDTIYSI